MSSTITNQNSTTQSGSPTSTRSTDDDNINTTPLLSTTTTTTVTDGDRTTNPTATIRRSIRRQSLRDAAWFLRRASSRRMMREPSMVVREAAAEQLEERQSDWAYSKPIVILDFIWNLAFVAVSVATVILSREEDPIVPLRVWVVGYAAQCVLHMACVCAEYRRRRRRRRRVALGFGSRSESRSGLGGRESDGDLSSVSGEYVSLAQLEEDNTSSVAKHLESANTMFSFIWWIIGFYWVSAGGQNLARDSPMLYWLCIVFLGFDVFFVVFCVALACIIGIAVCCCLPCIIAILYAVADQEGASKEDIDQLAKFKFRRIGDDEKVAGAQGSGGGIMTECGTDSPSERFLLQEDAECCICISAYDDGVELRELPCGHHFHCACVDKWLCINATCPLCKYNILKSSNHDQEEA